MALGDQSPPPRAQAAAPRAGRKGIAILIIAVCTLAAAGAAFLVGTLRPAQYEARAGVLVSPVPDDSPLRGLPVVMESSEPGRSVETAAGLIDTDGAAEATARVLGGDWTTERVRESIVVQPRGQSYLVEIVGRSVEAREAGRLVETFSRIALARRDEAVRQAARERSSALGTQPETSTIPAEELAARTAALEFVARDGDPSLSFTGEYRMPVLAGLSPLTLLVLGSGFGLVTGVVLSYVWDARRRPSATGEPAASPGTSPTR